MRNVDGKNKTEAWEGFIRSMPPEDYRDYEYGEGRYSDECQLYEDYIEWLFEEAKGG